MSNAVQGQIRDLLSVGPCELLPRLPLGTVDGTALDRPPRLEQDEYAAKKLATFPEIPSDGRAWEWRTVVSDQLSSAGPIR